MAKQKIGKCHICGIEGPLSFEHVPPHSAYNNKRVLKSTISEVLNRPPDELGNYQIQQNGSGDYTLCTSCNNNTGSWYGSDYVNFAHLGLLALDQAIKSDLEFHTGSIHPLRIIKQVITMFFSVNQPGFAEANPDLVSFVLNRERKYLPDDVFISMYMNRVGRGRFFPVSGHGDLDRGFEIISEFSFPPFGFVLSFDKEPFYKKLYNIRFFSSFGYNDQVVLFLPLYILPTFSHLPGDYRTLEQMKADRLKWNLRSLYEWKSTIIY